MNFVFSLLVLFLSPVGYAQSKLLCNTEPKYPSGMKVLIDGQPRGRLLSLLHFTGDIVLVPRDSSYKVVGFVLHLPCQSLSLVFDGNTQQYEGNRIKTTDRYYRSLATLDFFTIECITVARNGVLYNAPSMLFEISENKRD
jgi:hypothetical protein